ncbi:MAG: phosphate ABC transporter ATP-binding protein [Subdoligranulum sp.]|jgi:phosphate ABC transporter, ATP-binding protein|nr:MAG: phosphate ABC transporter ATP-binding protein [Subdoligranulum sp.]
MSIRYLFGKKKAYTDAETKTKEKTTGSKARSISDFAFDGDVAVKTENLDLFYGEMQALKHIDMTVPTRKVTALIGPSGCGKSTLLRTFNRMNDLVEGCKVSGSVKIGGTDVYQTNVNLTALRKNVGMVFQKPNPFPMSIYDNVAFGPRNFGIKNKAELDFIVETSLKQAAMWDELKDRLGKSALGISGGQQQRLCIARALAVSPQILLMDEPTSALDPISTGKIEELCMELKENVTILIVTHNMQQAARISDKTGFFLLGDLVEYGDTEQIFSAPQNPETEKYITGRFG